MLPIQLVSLDSLMQHLVQFPVPWVAILQLVQLVERLRVRLAVFVGGFVSPDPFTATVVGSVAGQLAGQAYDNFENGRPIAADLTIDGPVTVGAAAGAVVGGPVAKAALRVAPVTRGAVIGSELGSETVGRLPGKTAASGLEGFFAGAGEAIGAKVSDALGFEGVPNTLQITDSGRQSRLSSSIKGLRCRRTMLEG